MSDDNFEFLEEIDFDAIEKANQEKMEQRDAEAVVEDSVECESCKI
ncbi:MAG: hypothetical protein Q4G44_07825 [Alcaligenaceae bacterium]|nr:hypothetical protein [Alcaligenaceae bacterium]